jgi:predicted SprT family Zn-dependent metalloprotease
MPRASHDGAVHDLAAILRELRARYFPDCPEVTIGWGRWSGRPRARSMRLGVYLAAARHIRIHPALDQAFVPRQFVAFIVYHELLHHVMPPTREHGRCRVHTAAFRACERAFPGYAEVIAWRQRHLQRLLAAHRRHATGASRRAAT